MFYSRKGSFLSNSFFTILIILMVFIVAATTTYAAELGNDFSTDSAIELTEIASGGDYRNKSIKIITVNGKTTITVVTDGNIVSSEMPYQECEALWNYVLEKHAEYLEDVIGGALPDASSFTLKIRVGSNSHNFKVEGVDSLVDSRYKDIVKEIIRAVQTHAS